MKSILSICSYVILAALLLACENKVPNCGCVAPPLASTLMGKWEWIKTVTPTKTITPENAGYKRTFQYDNDGSSNFIAFSQNDSVYLRFAPVRGSYKEDLEENTITEQYESKFLKYYLKKGSYNWPAEHEMQTSELLPFQNSADTIRHFYKYISR
ncbi:hypothetical protein L0657_26995 [Dyadobacter sp. CY345]|uniref:hypothetical protein n=1 Tax=Dyadobacter sp. CY345 TaxID=2909335 RepID=UPI001F215E78|nr:hypothetical protein [Dyadobacter sp. CY345]MCF2447632.1 hypothetical protein [Dyadobacter sp. CY345]